MTGTSDVCRQQRDSFAQTEHLPGVVAITSQKQDRRILVKNRKFLTQVFKIQFGEGKDFGFQPELLRRRQA